MGNNPEGATSTKIFFLEVGGPGFEKLKLITEPSHILYEEDRISLPIDDRMVEEVANPEIGIINPLTVRKMPDGTLEIISGRQRFKWAVEAKRRHSDSKIKIPFRIMSLRDYNSLKASAIENAHRKEDSIVSRGEKARRMVESGFEQSEICDLYGVEWRTIQNWMSVSTASDAVREAVITNKISETTAVKIARKPIDKQIKFVEKETQKGRQKPGRKKGDNRRRIRITATAKESGGFEIATSKWDGAELKSIINELNTIYQNWSSHNEENI